MISEEFYGGGFVKVDLDKNLVGHCHIETGYGGEVVGTPYELRKEAEELAMKKFYHKNKEKK